MKSLKARRHKGPFFFPRYLLELGNGRSFSDFRSSASMAIVSVVAFQKVPVSLSVSDSRCSAGAMCSIATATATAISSEHLHIDRQPSVRHTDRGQPQEKVLGQHKRQSFKQNPSRGMPGLHVSPGVAQKTVSFSEV